MKVLMPQRTANDVRLYKFLREAGQRPYRELIQHHVERDNAAHLATARRGEVDLLPDPLKPRAESFVDAINERLLADRHFWQTATCRGAVHRIVEPANQHFGLSLRVPVNPELSAALLRSAAVWTVCSNVPARASRISVSMAKVLAACSTAILCAFPVRGSHSTA